MVSEPNTLVPGRALVAAPRQREGLSLGDLGHGAHDETGVAMQSRTYPEILAASGVHETSLAESVRLEDANAMTVALAGGLLRGMYRQTFL
jgi:hypothetical protein